MTFFQSVAAFILGLILILILVLVLVAALVLIIVLGTVAVLIIHFIASFFFAYLRFSALIVYPGL